MAVKLGVIDLKRYLLSLALVAFASPAYATTENNKTVAHVGAQGNNGYVTFTVAPAGGCAFGNLYFDVSTESGKIYYATLLTAYSTGRPISRVDYTNTAGTCKIDLLEV